MHCAACDYQSSVIAGTISQDTHAPLTLWFRAIWYITSQKNGTSALGLQRILGLGSYRTAWAWLHKLRRAMVRPGRDRLHGRVEVDETFVGGEEDGISGRRRGDKSEVKRNSSAGFSLVRSSQFGLDLINREQSARASKP